MKKIINWYTNLSLTHRVIWSMNIVTFVSILIISVFAVINRINVQEKDAAMLVSDQLEQITDLLGLLQDRPIADLERIIESRTLYHSGYISIVSAEGEVLISRHKQGQNIASQTWFPKLRTFKSPIIYSDPQTGEVNYLYHRYYEPLKVYATATIEKKELLDKPVMNTLMILIFALFFSMLIFSFASYFIMKSITNPIQKLIGLVRELGKGNLTEHFSYNSRDEVGQITSSVKELTKGLQRTTIFANQIEKKEFDHSFEPLSDQDVLGNALLDMRKSLKLADEEEKIRKSEDEKRNWNTQGLAMFAEILRKNNDNLAELSYDIIKNLVDYLQINQGGIFIINDDDPGEIFLELTACYAFDRRKFLQKRILPGEGLVGTCYLEREPVYMTRIPQDYIRITSGLGDENPSSLLLIPLKLNEKIFGVIELASFTAFDAYKMSFVEKIGESIASTISTVKINSQTAMLLKKSQQQAEEMKAQEEEMRQNMEELAATQEAMADKERENVQAIENLIKENKLKTGEIKSLERELTSILDVCPQAVVRVNEDGKIVFFNLAAQKLWGYNRQEVLRKHLSMLLANDPAALSQWMHGNEAGEKDWMPVVIALKEGKTSESEVKPAVYQSGNGSLKTFFFKEISNNTPLIHDLDKTAKTFKVDVSENIIPPIADNPVVLPPGSISEPTPDESAGQLHTGDVTDNQKAWTDHIGRKGKTFKKPRKK